MISAFTVASHSAQSTDKYCFASAFFICSYSSFLKPLQGTAHPGPLFAELQSDAYRLLGPCVVGQGIEGTCVRPDEPRDGYAPPGAGNIHAEIDRIRAQTLGSEGPLDAYRVSPEGPRENQTNHVELRHLGPAIRVRAPGHVRVVAEIEKLDPRPRIHSLPQKKTRLSGNVIGAPADRVQVSVVAFVVFDLRPVLPDVRGRWIGDFVARVGRLAVGLVLDRDVPPFHLQPPGRRRVPSVVEAGAADPVDHGTGVASSHVEIKLPGK